MAWDRADRWTVSGHLCGRELSCGERGASSAVLKVTVMCMPERRLFRLIKSDTPLNTLVSKALSLYRYRIGRLFSGISAYLSIGRISISVVH